MNALNLQPQSAVLTMASIREAHERIRDKIHRTPVMTSEVLDSLARARLYFKCENLQKAGAFKARGATNAVFLLSEAEAARGVVTHSSGNHAAALARAARHSGIHRDAEERAPGQAGRREALRRRHRSVRTDPGSARNDGPSADGKDRCRVHSSLR
jgi:threonine dehydratase